MAVLLGGIIFIGIWAVIIYNSIIGGFNSTREAWANVIATERQKNKVIPEIEKLVEGYKEYEGGVLKDITKLRSAIKDLDNDDVGGSSLKQTEQMTAQLMKSLQVTVEAYPDLKASDAYTGLMKEISEIQENIAAAIRMFNNSVKNFNDSIEMFPNVIVNNMTLKKKRINEFSDSQAEEGFEYKLD